MDTSTNNLENWMLFINNCELIFKLYQLRKQSQIRQHRQQQLQSQDMDGSRAGGSGGYSQAGDSGGYSEAKAAGGIVTTQGSHVNLSYIEEVDATSATIQLHKVAKGKVEMMDTAIQTSGEWQDILNSIQQPCYSLIDTHRNFRESASTSQDIEMKCLTSDGRERTHGYCNDAYEPDLHLVEAETECRTSEKFKTKSVKFSGCEIIEEQSGPCLSETAVWERYEMQLMLSRRQWHHRHMNTEEGKWSRIRQMNLHQQGEILSYDGRVMLDTRDVGFAQARHPLTPANFYFKVTVLETGSDSFIAIGLTAKRYPSYEMPGWRKRSAGYHADDGRLYVGEEDGIQFGPKLKNGDELCCGLLFTEEWTAMNATDSNNKQTNRSHFISAYEQSARDLLCDPVVTFVKMFVMLNGEMLGVKVTGFLDGEYYPTVGLLSEGAAVRVDLLPALNLTS